MRYGFMVYIDDNEFREIIIYSKEYFKYVDASFFGGVSDILTHVGEKMQKLSIDDNDNTDFPEELHLKSFDIVEDFYNSLSPDLGNMARVELRHSHAFVPRESVFGKKEMTEEEKEFAYKSLIVFLLDQFRIFSSASWKDPIEKNIQAGNEGSNSELPFDDSWASVFTDVHEVAHRFVVNDFTTLIPENKPSKGYASGTLRYPFEQMKWNYWNVHRRSGISNYIIQETAPMYAEECACDYVKKEYNVHYNGYHRVRYNSLKKYTLGSNSNEINYLRSIKEYVEFLQSNELNDNTFPIFKDLLGKIIKLYSEKENIVFSSDVKRILSLTMSSIYDPHTVGFLFSNYLHQQTSDDSDKKLDTFQNLLRASSIINEFEEADENNRTSNDIVPSRIGLEEIICIQRIGLPIAKDGKLQIDSNDVKLITDAFDKTLERDHALFRYEASREDVDQEIQ